MNWYLDVIKKYAVFSGRARRKEYWMFALINFVIVIVLEGLFIFPTLLNGNGDFPTFGYILVMLYSFGLFLPSLGVMIRRLHDVGKSGWWYFVALIPFIGAIWLLILLISDSQPGTNQYGPNPKEPASLVEVL
jgi:uncharacterized membrane protein YhaH (DUF805 family)